MESGGGGQQVGWGWGLRSRSHLPRRLFCFKAASADAVGHWYLSSQRGLAGPLLGALPERSALGRDALGLVPEVDV